MDGRFVSRSSDDSAAITALDKFETDPHKASALEGHATGACCFCGRELETAASVRVGYCPVCAVKYGLPWGDGSNSDNVSARLATFKDEPEDSPMFAEERAEVSEAIEGARMQGKWTIVAHYHDAAESEVYPFSYAVSARRAFDSLDTNRVEFAMLKDSSGNTVDSWGT